MTNPPSHPIDSSVQIRQIPNCPGYFVSENGEILSNVINCGRGGRKLGGPLKIRSQIKMRTGYRYAHLFVSGKRISTGIHRLVLISFVGEPPTTEHQCAHENGNPSDNRLSNLSWKTRPDNEADKDRHGTLVVGSNHTNSKLTPESVSKMRADYAKGGVSIKTLGEQNGVTEMAAYQAIHRRTWKHVA